MDLETVSPTYSDDTELNELYEVLLSCCNDSLDRNIIKLRTERYQSKEIIFLLNLDKNMYHRRLRNIVRKFKDALL